MPSLGVAAELRGHVVLVDFWTLTCISWPRTEPYLRAWSRSYRNDGLALIGIHTPEFSFEHEIDRVRQAAKERGIAPPAQARTWCPSVPVVTERPPTGTA
jgi:thiol-disulfide isomerase/thioredoxin